jgi:hypothetical protein
MEEVVAQHQRRRYTRQKVSTDQERLGQAVGAWFWAEALT